MPARTLMFQGTGSDVGKSLIVAGLARAYAKRGLAVRPFKPQNMSNNAAVTSDGGEIGRAQALQARAAGIPASVHMNPVLLKPQSEIGAQIVVQGRIYGSAKAAAYQEIKTGPSAIRARQLRAAARARPISFSSKAPAALRKSIFGQTTSPIWDLPKPRTCRWC